MDKTHKWKMRLIDADELCADRVSNDPVVIVAKCAPTIDAEPVRHGRWIYDPNANDWNIEEYVGDYNFCPVCGAPMTDEAVEMLTERLEAMKDVR